MIFHYETFHWNKILDHSSERKRKSVDSAKIARSIKKVLHPSSKNGLSHTHTHRTYLDNKEEKPSSEIQVGGWGSIEAGRPRRERASARPLRNDDAPASRGQRAVRLDDDVGRLATDRRGLRGDDDAAFIYLTFFCVCDTRGRLFVTAATVNMFFSCGILHIRCWRIFIYSRIQGFFMIATTSIRSWEYIFFIFIISSIKMIFQLILFFHSLKL